MEASPQVSPVTMPELLGKSAEEYANEISQLQPFFSDISKAVNLYEVHQRISQRHPDSNGRTAVLALAGTAVSYISFSWLSADIANQRYLADLIDVYLFSRGLKFFSYAAGGRQWGINKSHSNIEKSEDAALDNINLIIAHKGLEVFLDASATYPINNLVESLSPSFRDKTRNAKNTEFKILIDAYIRAARLTPQAGLDMTVEHLDHTASFLKDLLQRIRNDKQQLSGKQPSKQEQTYLINIESIEAFVVNAFLDICNVRNELIAVQQGRAPLPREAMGHDSPTLEISVTRDDEGNRIISGSAHGVELSPDEAEAMFNDGELTIPIEIRKPRGSNRPGRTGRREREKRTKGNEPHNDFSDVLLESGRAAESPLDSPHREIPFGTAF